MKSMPVRKFRSLNLSLVAVALIVLSMTMLVARVPHLVRDSYARGVEWVGDFQNYYYAFFVLLKHPAESWALYERGHLIVFLRDAGVTHFTLANFYGYPPQFAAVFQWLAYWDMSTARTIWSLISICSFVIACALTLNIAYRGHGRSVYVLLVAIVLLCRPIVDDIYWGQSNSLLFVMLAATFFLIERGNRYAAGFFLAMAIAFKITPLAVAGLLLVRKEWRVLISTFLVSIVLAWYTALQTGWQVIIGYYMHDLPRLNGVFARIGGAPFNSSLKGVLQTYSGRISPMSMETINHLSTIFGLAICLLACYLVWRRARDSRIDYALSTATMLAASPVIESVHMVVVLIPLLILIGTRMEEQRQNESYDLPASVELSLCGLAIVLLMFSARSVTYTVAILLVYFLCAMRYSVSRSSRRVAARVL